MNENLCLLSGKRDDLVIFGLFLTVKQERDISKWEIDKFLFSKGKENVFFL